MKKKSLTSNRRVGFGDDGNIFLLWNQPGVVGKKYKNHRPEYDIKTDFSKFSTYGNEINNFVSQHLPDEIKREQDPNLPIFINVPIQYEIVSRTNTLGPRYDVYYKYIKFDTIKDEPRAKFVFMYNVISMHFLRYKHGDLDGCNILNNYNRYYIIDLETLQKNSSFNDIVNEYFLVYKQFSRVYDDPQVGIAQQVQTYKFYTKFVLFGASILKKLLINNDSKFSQFRTLCLKFLYMYYREMITQLKDPEIKKYTEDVFKLFKKHKDYRKEISIVDEYFNRDSDMQSNRIYFTVDPIKNFVEKENATYTLDNIILPKIMDGINKNNFDLVDSESTTLQFYFDIDI
jgi:hypothetical protein